jgi:hypothetical protein
MTHGRTEKSRVNVRKIKKEALLTRTSEKPGKSLECRVASLEMRVAELEEEVRRVSGEVPAHFYGGLVATGKKPGPSKSIPNDELWRNRDALVYWLEENWSQIVQPLLAAHNPRQLRAVLEQVARTPDIRPPWQNRFVGHPAKLLDFLRSDKFRIKPPRKTVIDALGAKETERRQFAANRLPTRQIANAMAGVPRLKWRTSLDKCSQKPSSSRVAHNTERYFRATFRISEDKTAAAIGGPLISQDRQ